MANNCEAVREFWSETKKLKSNKNVNFQKKFLKIFDFAKIVKSVQKIIILKLVCYELK